MTPIAVTGLGLITALGKNLSSTYERLILGEHGISQVAAWDVSDYATKCAAEIKFPLPINFSEKAEKNLDRGHKLLLSAVDEALQDAGITTDQLQGLRVGIVVGTSLAGMESMQTYDTQLFQHLKTETRHLYNKPLHVSADLIAKKYNLFGPKMVVSTACTASTIAIGIAIAWLRQNKADIVIAAGCDQLSRISYTGFSCMRNMSDEASSPFSEKIGLTLGEGAGAIILQKNNDHKIKSYGYASEYMFSADAYHPTSPDPKGQATEWLLTQLLNKANLNVSDIDYINLHGTGTSGNDATESSVIERMFYQKGNAVPTSSIKGALGHTLGAAGIVESVLTIKAMSENILLPTANFISPRDGCRLNYIENKTQQKNIQHAIVQNFAFGGNNAALLFSKLPMKRASVNKKRVVVTGMSAISALGYNLQIIKENIERGQKGIKDYYSPEYDRYFRAAKIEKFNSTDFIKINTRRMDRLSQLIVSAVHKTLLDASLPTKELMAEPVGLISGTMFGHAESNLNFHRDILTKHPSEIDPFKFPNTVANAGSGQASVISRLKGCNIAIGAGQGSGLAAIQLAYELIQDNRHKAIIAGGADELIDYILFNYWQAGLIRSHATHPVTIFDRPAFNEGASYFMLEDYEYARARGAHIYAEITDAHMSTIALEVGVAQPSLQHVKSDINAMIERHNLKQKIKKIYTSPLPYKQFAQVEREFYKETLHNSDSFYINTHDAIGLSAMTTALNFGLACLDHDDAIVNAASLGGTHWSMLVKPWKA
ncbi:MAG: beta-ketoacyl-[acyl-carrier-protein] synthase family protein [Pseudomonadota bacterium]